MGKAKENNLSLGVHLPGPGSLGGGQRGRAGGGARKEKSVFSLRLFLALQTLCRESCVWGAAARRSSRAVREESSPETARFPHAAAFSFDCCYVSNSTQTVLHCVCYTGLTWKLLQVLICGAWSKSNTGLFGWVILRCFDRL